MSQFKNFEKDLESLDKLVESLESGDLSLSDALKAFESGVKLYATCHETLQGVEEQVKILVDDIETGEKKMVPFENVGE
jgi:exodeoxyribonuclease VII small subunit